MMSNEFVAMQIAQNQTARYAREALPDSPVIADVGFGPREGRIVRFRQGLSENLYTLANRISPEPDNLSGRGAILAPSGHSAPRPC